MRDADRDFDEDLPPDPGGPEETEETALVPPHDLDAEGAVLSAVLIDPERIPSVSFLDPEHFYSESHRRIYEAVCEVRKTGSPVDVVTVGAWLKDRDRLKQVGGMPYLSDVLNVAPYVRNVETYGTIVFEKWRLRQLIDIGSRLCARAHADTIESTQKFLEDAVKQVAVLARDSPTSPNEPQWMVLRRVMAGMTAAANLPSSTATPGLPTGIRSLDLKTLGLQPGKKITVMAQRGRGKTSFLLQLAMYAAGWRGRRQPLADRRVAVKVFSTEMTKREIAIKQMAYAARIDSQRLERQEAQPTLTMEEWDRLQEAMPLLERLVIDVDDRPSPSVDDIVSITRQDAARASTVDGLPLGFVGVDYVQRLATPDHMRSGRFREDEQILHNSKTLKLLAQELQLPVVELAQMNAPDPKVSKTGRPYEGLAAKCKGIENESDIVLCLWRRKKDNNNDYGLTCTKMRGGVEVDLDLEIEFEPEYSTFVDPAYRGFRSAFEDFA